MQHFCLFLCLIFQKNNSFNLSFFGIEVFRIAQSRLNVQIELDRVKNFSNSIVYFALHTKTHQNVHRHAFFSLYNPTNDTQKKSRWKISYIFFLLLQMTTHKTLILTKKVNSNARSNANINIVNVLILQTDFVYIWFLIFILEGIHSTFKSRNKRTE